MTHHYIPFVNSSKDSQLVTRFYAESAGWRTTLQSLEKTMEHPEVASKLWIDASVDGLHSPKINDPDDQTNPPFKQYISQFEFFGDIADPTFQKSPDRKRVGTFVRAVLDRANSSAGAAWLSVPQLPYFNNSDRNKINKALAEATSDWKSKTRYRGKLILPIVLAKSDITRRKTSRNPKVELAAACYKASDANGVWVVDSTIDDQDGIKNFESERFPGIIKFHEELNAVLPVDTVAVAGPYWALNVVLWARGLVHCLNIGVGKSYRYYVPGGRQNEGSPRVAIAPLRRLAVWSPALKSWIEQSLKTLNKEDPAHKELSLLLRDFSHLNTKENARQQVARFYKEWLEKLEIIPASSRALALYQDFSAAYVLGMGLRPLPPSEAVRDPARIAKQFLSNCL